MVYIRRALEGAFLRAAGEYPAVLVTGPRQTGKTTMLQKLSGEEDAGREYVTLDDLNERSLAKTDPKMFLQVHKPPLLIDEAQYAPELFTYIKIYVDRNPAPGSFWLTGSQVFKLAEGISESLAGRICVMRLNTMSQAEIAGAPPLPFECGFDALTARARSRVPCGITELYQRIFSGGMPSYVSGRYTDSRMMYSSYIETYISRDIREVVGAVDSLKFLNFITAAAALAGQVLNCKTIADAVGMKIPVVKAWLEILERLGVVFFLHPYSNNALKRTITKPKLYFYDTALVCYLTKWSDAATLMSGAMSGAALENFAVSEIVKSYLNCVLEPHIYYYRDRDSREIDVILEGNGKLYPIEIKKTAMPTRHDARVRRAR